MLSRILLVASFVVVSLLLIACPDQNDDDETSNPPLPSPVESPSPGVPTPSPIPDSPTPEATDTPTPLVTPSPTPIKNTPTPTPKPTPTPTPEPTSTPIPPTPTPSPTPIPPTPTPPTDGDGDGYVASEDCDDTNPSINPGGTEICDDQDNDCDGEVDEGVTSTFYADGDKDGYGSPESSLEGCEMPSGYVANATDCDDGDAGVFPGMSGCAFDVSGWSCRQILDSGDSLGDGVYQLDPDGDEGPVEPFNVYCDMTTDGGGWTLGFVKNSVHEGEYGAFGSGYVDVAYLEFRPEDASSAETGVAGWLDLNVLNFEVIRLASYYEGVRTYISDDIYREDLRIQFGQPGYLLYGDRNGYYWCGGVRSFTDYGSGQVNQPSGAPADCKDHGGLGAGFDFSQSLSHNLGLTMCGSDGVAWMYGYYGDVPNYIYYPTPGAAYAFWAR